MISLFLIIIITIYNAKTIPSWRVDPFEKAGKALFELGVSEGLWIVQRHSIAYWNNQFHNTSLKLNNKTWNNFSHWFKIPEDEDPEYYQYMKTVNDIRNQLAIDVFNNIDEKIYSQWYLIDFVSTFDFALKEVFLSYNTSIEEVYGFMRVRTYMSYWLGKLLDATGAVKENLPLRDAVNIDKFNNVYSFIETCPELKPLYPNFSFTVYNLKVIKPYWNVFIKSLYENAFSYNNSHII